MDRLTYVQEREGFMKKTLCHQSALAVDALDPNPNPTSDSWLPAPGLASQEKCQASVKEKLDMWRQFKDAKFDGNSVTFTSNNSSMIYLCLPENEDPRKQPKPIKPQK